ncbi:hypothetical protein Fmac_005029 [Flemingia macrophylla]|uniref:Uncharacterized protein n=1 Tax=Flemingia macrophylla TaxID=520843 RepID=A0ABD1N6M1_9FABA
MMIEFAGYKLGTTSIEDKCIFELLSLINERSLEIIEYELCVFMQLYYLLVFRIAKAIT